MSGDLVHVDHVGWLAMPAGDDVVRYVREGWFEYGERSFCRLYLRPGDAVIDAGSHAGLYTLLASAIVGAGGRVVAVEAGARTRALLEANIEAAGASNASVVGKAVWSHDRGVVFDAGGEEDAAYAHVAGDDAGETAQGGERVESVTLDAVAESHGLDRVALIKMDLEGAEAEAAAGAARLIGEKRVAVAMVEVTARLQHARGLTAADELTPWLDAGYTAARWDPEAFTLEPVDPRDLGEHENVLCCADLGAVRERVAGADEASVRIARDIVSRGVTCRALADRAVQRDHLASAVDDLRGDLATTHASWSAAQKAYEDALDKARRRGFA